jgi:hypothetical protein
MTRPHTAMASRSTESMPLYPDEDRIAVEVMGPRRAKDWPEKARYLEDKHGLPRVDELMGGRFWPAVVDFFRARYAMKPGECLDVEPAVAPSFKVSSSIRVVPYRADGKEQYDGQEASPAAGRRHRGRGHR